jgi:hypothetical protein
MQSYQDDEVDNDLYYSFKLADNNSVITELEDDIEVLEKNKINTEDIIFKCDKCKKTACIFELFFQYDKQVFQIQTGGFIGEITTRYIGKEQVSIEVFKKIRESLNNPNILNDLDYDLFGFICNKCNKVYCKDCWSRHTISFDEGFYEDTQATCPEGHKQLIQD